MKDVCIIKCNYGGKEMGATDFKMSFFFLHPAKVNVDVDVFIMRMFELELVKGSF